MDNKKRNEIKCKIKLFFVKIKYENLLPNAFYIYFMRKVFIIIGFLFYF